MEEVARGAEDNAMQEVDREAKQIKIIEAPVQAGEEREIQSRRDMILPRRLQWEEEEEEDGDAPTQCKRRCAI